MKDAAAAAEKIWAVMDVCGSDLFQFHSINRCHDVHCARTDNNEKP